MKRKYVRYMILLAVILLVVWLYRSCSPFLGYAEEIIYTSPEGTNTIVVKYDLVSRPDVYKKEGRRDIKIWGYENPGFMETVHFEVEWLSENQIRLSYDNTGDEKYDEEYLITIPE